MLVFGSNCGQWGEEEEGERMRESDKEKDVCACRLEKEDKEDNESGTHRPEAEALMGRWSRW